MEVVFIPIEIKIKELKNFDKLIEILPKEIGIVCLSQYSNIINSIISKLKEKNIKVYTKDPNYVLGCNVESANLPVDTILLIGDGKFHAIEIYRKYRKKVIVYDPISGNFFEIKEIPKKYNKIYYLLEKLKDSKNVGIVLSIKPGQYYENIKSKIIEKIKEKNIYFFIGDNIDLNNLKNFTYIDFWIILACPRIFDDILENEINALTFDYL